MVYEFTGRVLHSFAREGQGKNGPWKMWECVVEHDTTGQFPRRVLVSVWDENVFNTIQVNSQCVRINCSIDAREYNGRWFNDIRAFSAYNPNYQQQQQQPMRQAPGYVPQQIPFQQNQYGNAVAPGYAPQQGNSGGFNGVDPNTGLPF